MRYVRLLLLFHESESRKAKALAINLLELINGLYEKLFFIIFRAELGWVTSFQIID